MKGIEQSIIWFADWIWGIPLLVLLLGGGTFFLIYSRFIPFRYLGHAVHVLRGKYDNPDDPGQINHFQALSTALAATVGMGNISGVAIAIATGGPGALFWMWVIATVGMATKFFTCTLAVMYRGKDSAGELQGGPMYVIREGLGQKWMPLAIFFSLAALIGALPIFQANQLTAVLHDVVLQPAGVNPGFASRAITGATLLVLVSIVIFGGIQRIGKVASRLVPLMVVLYFLSVVFILIRHYDVVGYYFKMIFTDAFQANFYHGSPVLGGVFGGLVILGARRAAFSNEAGAGSAAIAHSAVKTKYPASEGVVALLEPFIDTVVICTMTALVIIFFNMDAGAFEYGNAVNSTVLITETGNYVGGVDLTSMAYDSVIPGFRYILTIAIILFAFSTMISWSYYGLQSWKFLFGRGKYADVVYKVLFLLFVVIGAGATLDAVIKFSDAMILALVFPNMIGLLFLFPRVKEELNKYVMDIKGMNK